MEEKQLSQTAIRTACYRAYHASCDNPVIFNDFLARPLLGEEELSSHEQQMLTSFRSVAPEFAATFPNDSAILTFMMQAMAAPALTFSRARYAEDCLDDAISKGIQQYVILGAGMDTFAFRRPELLKKLPAFEVDHPATQAYKCQRLAELGWEQSRQLHFVPVDFTKESLTTVLKNSAYDPSKPSFFSWLGVTYYLPRDAVFATLNSIAEIAPRGSRVAFDYLDTDAFNPAQAVQRVQFLLMMAQGAGEPMSMGFNPSTIGDELSGLGLTIAEDLAPANIQQRYFQGRSDKYYACEHAHLLCAVVE